MNALIGIGIAAVIMFGIGKLINYFVFDDEWDRHQVQTNTVLAFDRFKILYNADPENWSLSSGTTCINPIYENKGKKYVVKMASKKDYKRFKKWVKETQKEGLAPGEMASSMELTRLIQEVANERAEKAREEITKQYEEIVQRVESAAKQTGGMVLRSGDVAVRIGPDDVTIKPRGKKKKES